MPRYVTCPTCGSRGQRCVRPGGDVASAWHAPRRKLAEQGARYPGILPGDVAERSAKEASRKARRSTADLHPPHPQTFPLYDSCRDCGATESTSWGMRDGDGKPTCRECSDAGGWVDGKYVNPRYVKGAGPRRRASRKPDKAPVVDPNVAYRASCLLRVSDSLDEEVRELLGQCGNGAPVNVLESAVAVQAVVERIVYEAVELARAAGETWACIGDALGVSKQAAQARFTTSSASTVRDERQLALAD